MRRVLRILTSVVMAISLFLCTVAILAWVRSYRTADTFILNRVSREPGVLTDSEHAVLWGRGTLRYEVHSTVYKWDRADRLDVLEKLRRREGGQGCSYSVNPVDWIERTTRTKLRWSVGPIAVAGFRGASKKQWLDAPLLVGLWRTEVGQQFDVRLWLVVLVCALAPSASVACSVRRCLRQRRRGRAGLCPLCGYDLLATPDRCPECGRVPEVARPAPPR